MELTAAMQRTQAAVGELVDWRERGQPLLEAQLQKQATATQALRLDVERQHNQLTQQLIRHRGYTQADVAQLEERLSHMKVEQQRLALRVHVMEQEQIQVVLRLEDVEDCVVQ